MDEQTKQYLVIGITVVCLSVAGTMSYRSFFGGSGGGDTGDRQIALMCASCGGFEVSVDEFREIMSQQGPDLMMMMMPGQAATMECPQCGKKSCYQAQKCKQCETIFVFGQAKDKNYPDRCPKCSFSYIEDRRQNPAP